MSPRADRGSTAKSSSKEGLPPAPPVGRSDGVLFPLILIGLLVAGTKAGGQEALRSTLMVDRATERQPSAPVTEGKPHVGPVEFSAGVRFSTEFNDNINTSEIDPLSDLILTPEVTLDLLWPATDSIRLNLNVGLSYRAYVENPEFSRVEFSPDTYLSLDVGFKNGFLTFFNLFSYQQSVVTDAALANQAQFPRLDNTIGVRATWLPHKWVIQGGISHNNYWSTEDAFAYLDRASQYLFGRVGWQFTEATQAGVESSFSVTDYRLPLQSDNWSVSLGGFADWQITHDLRASVRGGPVFYHFDPSTTGEPSRDLNTYYVGLDLTHQATQRISHRLNVRRDVRLGQNLGSDFIVEFMAGYGANWSATDRLGLGLGVTYVHGQQPVAGLTSGIDEDYDQFSITPYLTYRFATKFTGRVTYAYYNRQSNFDGRNYLQNRVTLGLDYQF